mgnify:CR=1 FL=1
MSLSQALVSAISGLKVNQSSLALVAANVSNAETPGYVRKTVIQVAVSGNNTGIGVRISAIQRDLGFEPTTSIDVGVPRFVDWYRAYHHI